MHTHSKLLLHTHCHGQADTRSLLAGISARPSSLASVLFSNLHPVCAGNVVLAAEIRVQKEKYMSESVMLKTTDC